MDKQNFQKYFPAIVVFCIVTGIAVGMYMGGKNVPQEIMLRYGGSNKIDRLLSLIETDYVDTVNFHALVEDILPKVLEELDPHSAYLPAEATEASNADLRGSFSGIGIQFTIQEDTIHVNSVIRGGPSERVGLLAGDRIVAVDDSVFVGEKVSNNEAMKRLKGPKGSKVKITVLRPGEKELLDFEIVRGNIPVKSIDAAYLIQDKYGYLNINKFGETTYAEMMLAIARFVQEGYKGLIVDLRGNLGGYMGAALQMANEFLKKGEMIVYTEGVHQQRNEEYANGNGLCKEIPLVVLIDETSASASEIFSGTVQDNDRGTIIGRRSFGKGLVQQPFEFNDGSTVRLTVARYYTPSGRCIQKPYNKGDDVNYDMDIVTRYEHGEFFSQDSIRQNTDKTYRTALGRTVYGGGGIMPDIFVPTDTTGSTSYYLTANSQRLIVQYSYKYADLNRALAQRYTTMEAMKSYLDSQPVVENFVRFAAEKGLKPRYNQIAKSHELLKRALYAYIIYDLLDMEEHMKYLNLSDPAVLKAVDILENGKAFPEMPQSKE